MMFKYEYEGKKFEWQPITKSKKNDGVLTAITPNGENEFLALMAECSTLDDAEKIVCELTGQDWEYTIIEWTVEDDNV